MSEEDLSNMIVKAGYILETLQGGDPAIVNVTQNDLISLCQTIVILSGKSHQPNILGVIH